MSCLPSPYAKHYSPVFLSSLLRAPAALQRGFFAKRSLPPAAFHPLPSALLAAPPLATLAKSVAAHGRYTTSTAPFLLRQQQASPTRAVALPRGISNPSRAAG